MKAVKHTAVEDNSEAHKASAANHEEKVEGLKESESHEIEAVTQALQAVTVNEKGKEEQEAAEKLKVVSLEDNQPESEV